MPTRTLNGRYRLDELIGEGGMAVVYRGYDLVLGRVVAVKILRDQYGSDENFLRRFEREAQSAARLSHPNIANVYDVGVDGDTHYIVMEFVSGPNLKDLIRRQGPFTVEGVKLVIRQVAEALDFAHARGLVHRDIKPQNILVDENGNAKVVDFGIAKGLSDANLTEAGTGMGTVHYVSPEQARGDRATPSSDIYSTGVVLFEMLTKHLPFEADSPVGVAMRHVTMDPPSPRDFNPAIPPEVEAIVLKALAKEPEDRFATAGELAAALEHWDQVSVGSQRTRVMAGGAGGAVIARPPRGRAAPPPVAPRRPKVAPQPYVRDEPFRDDVGIVTWLIGAAILIGLVGLVVLGYRLGDFSFFDTPVDPTPTASLPTQPAVVVASPTPSIVPTATGAPTATTAAIASPTSQASPTARTSPTPTVNPTPTPPRPTPTPETVPVPSLIGSTEAQARTAVEVGPFELVVEQVFSNTFERGLIFEQDPRAGTRLEKGKQIRVKISRGPEFVTVPNVQNQPVNQAKAAIEARGLSVNIVEQSSTTVAEGRVISAEPATQAPAGSTVTLRVSMGDRVQVPNVYRMPREQAAFELTRAGLTVGAQTPQSCAFIRASSPTFDCASFPDGGVVSGTLQWESWVPRGSTINIGYYDAKAR